MDRSVRSRTNSTSSLRSPLQPATPSHTPNPSFGRLSNHQNLSPDQLAAGLSRIRAERGGSRSSSIPATPAPTPNPLLHVTYHMFPEQLAAGISNLEKNVDEGFDSTSFPATPTPSPFSPSPAQSASFTPDQVAEGIQRLREEGISGLSTAQPPTPSTTPRVVNINVHQQPLGIIPEHLAESINHLRTDEGLESGSNPATPIPTPLSPAPTSRGPLLPEQLAAGIHKLKFEEGMSSGGSSGFPSTPAPTPFVQPSGGVRPEELAAGISRLSVIEEAVVSVMEETTVNSDVSSNSAAAASRPDLSQYFGGSGTEERRHALAADSEDHSRSFFDQLNTSKDEAVLHSCRESRVDLPSMQEKGLVPAPSQARIEVGQEFDDETSLQHRQHAVHNAENAHSEIQTTSSIFQNDPNAFDSVVQDNVGGGLHMKKSAKQLPTTLEIDQRPLPPYTEQSLITTVQNENESLLTPNVNTAESSIYSTPVAPTPTTSQQDSVFQTTSTPSQKNFQQSSAANVTSLFPVQFSMNEPILSPLPIPGGCQPKDSNLISAQEGSTSTDNSWNLPESETKLDEATQKRVSHWNPGPATQQILKSVANSPQGSFYCDRASLTMPGVVIRDELADQVKNLVSHYRGESEASKRQIINADSVSQDPKGLRQLVRAGNYRAAVNLTSRLLQMYNQGPGQGGNLTKHTPTSLQIWFSRIALLIKLRQFSVAEVEAEAFGDLDRPDLYYEYYPDTSSGQTGSMAPFGFRIMLAELPQYLGKHHETLDRLYALLAKIKKILEDVTNDSSLGAEEKQKQLDLWKSRELKVLYSLVNSSILQKDYELAVQNMNILLEKVAKDVKPKIISGLGRIYLQLGDIESAQKEFSKAFKLRTNNDQTDKCSNLMDMAMLSIANSDFKEALETLQKVDLLEPDKPMVVNNIAVCFLYLGRLKDGLNYLESKITNNPTAFLYDTSILNLCTLYELESSYSGQKKRSLLDLVSRYKGDGINVSCLKLQT